MNASEGGWPSLSLAENGDRRKMTTIGSDLRFQGIYFYKSVQFSGIALDLHVEGQSPAVVRTQRLS